jgi:hypothetical protein
MKPLAAGVAGPFVLLVALVALPAFLRAAEPPAELHFSGEPIGSEYPLARGLEGDATDLAAADASIGAPDVGATTLQKGLLVRAYAETLRTAEAPDAVARARSAARRGLILARLGAVNFAAEATNAALAEPAVRDEVMLARAWMLWHAGALEAADRDAAQATGAPAWALAEWKAHRAKFAPALARFSAASEPDDVYSPAFLAHAELAAAARAFYLADGLYFRAVNNLQQQASAEPNFPPTNLQRARRGFRDLVRTILGDAAREPGAARLAALLVATAREVCATPATRADWETYFALLTEVRAHQPTFDPAHYDLHGDLARAEKEAGLDLAWRENLKPLLSDPRLRFASRVHQALARLEAHEGAALLNEPLETDFSPAQRATLQAYADLVAAEDAVLANLHQALPAGRASVPRDADYVVAVAKLRFRRALLAGDLAAAREQLAKLEQFPATDPALSLDAYRARLVALERGPFLTAYAQILRYPPTDVPEKHLEAALAAAEGIEEQLTERHGDAYLFADTLPADSVALVQRLCHLRVVVALSTGRVFSAERSLADLQLWCDPKKHPAFEPLPGLIAAVTAAPAQDDKLTDDEKRIWTSLKSGRADPSFPVLLRAAIAADDLRWSPHLLLPIAHWRLGQNDLALAAVARAKELVRYNRATLETLDTLVANNDPATMIRRQLTELKNTPASERRTKAAAMRKDLDALLRNLATYHCGGQRIEVKKLPPDAVRAYAFIVAGYIQCRLVEVRLRDAVDLLGTLETLKVPEALALAQPAVENFAFTNDLPDEAARATWRLLLEPGTVGSDQLKAALVQLKPAFEAGSLSAGMGAVVAPYRGRNYQQARSNLAMLQRLYGRVRAVSAQLAQLSRLLNETDEPPPIDFDESIDSLLERRRNLHQLSVNYKDANFDALADAYNGGYSTPELRHLEALCRDVDAVTAQIQAVEARQRAQRNADRQRQDAVRQDAYATLRRLMAL